MEQRNPGVLAYFFKAFIPFKAYPGFAKLRGGKVFLYILLLSFVSFLFATVPGYVRFTLTYGSFQSMIDEYVPEFKLENGLLTTDATYEFIEEDILFLLDTSTVFDEGVLYGNDQGIAIDCEKMIFVDTRQSMEPTILYFSELSELSDRFNEPVDKSALYAVIPFMRWFVALVCLFIYFGALLGTVFMSLVTSLAALLVNSFAQKTAYGFGGLFKLSIYVRTLPLVATNIIAILIPFFPEFFAFYVLVAILGIFTLNEKKRQEEEELLNAQTSMRQDNYYNNAFNQGQAYETPQADPFAPSTPHPDPFAAKTPPVDPFSQSAQQPDPFAQTAPPDGSKKSDKPDATEETEKKDNDPFTF